MKYRLLFSLFYLFLTLGLSAQKHEFKIFYEVPVHFGLGYGYYINENWSLQAQAGFITEPNSSMILGVIEGLGTDPLTVEMIEDAFEFGTVFEIGSNYHFGSWYTGVYFQTVFLQGKETPNEIVEEVMNVNISEYPFFRGRNSPASNQNLTLKSNLFQGGILIGKIFSLKDPTQKVFLEFGASLNLYSRSSLESNDRDLTELSNEVDDYLKDIYTTYAYIPTLNFGWVKKF